MTLAPLPGDFYNFQSLLSQDEGVYHDEHSALAKATCTYWMREVVGWARELLVGNCIVLDYNVGRFVADAEAIYS